MGRTDLKKCGYSYGHDNMPGSSKHDRKCTLPPGHKGRHMGTVRMDRVPRKNKKEFKSLGWW